MTAANGLFALLAYLCLISHVKGSLLDWLKIHGHEALPPPSHDVMDANRGFMMCAGNHMVGEVVQMIWQLRYHWKSKLGISVAHCGEISAANHEFIQLLDPSVKMLDICATNPVFGMPIDQARHRLRGFYCKVGAVIQSPFRETMLLDLDVVWFKSPDLLFSSNSYTSSGALFFRDRVYPTSPQRSSEYTALEKVFTDRGIAITQQTAEALAKENGFSFYWREIASRLSGASDFKQVSDIQDSSVLLIDRSRQGKMLAVMAELLPTFAVGYGDKEIFWVSATIARANFTFEPFLAAQYADCYGVILHYDPDDAGAPDSATPLYVNAEYMVEHDLQIVGQFLSPHMTPPVLVTADMVLAMNLNTWPGGFKRGDAGCTCKSFGCVDAPADVTKYMLYAEWVTYSKRLLRQGPDKDCIPVQASYAAALQEVFASEVAPQDCFFVGCPQLPITVDTSLPWDPVEAKRRYCEPVHFSPAPPSSLAALAQEARRPDSAFNRPSLPDGTPVQFGIQKQLYWYKNETLQPFADWDAFVSKGLDLDNVVRMSELEFGKFTVTDEFVH
jgi:hypothetical protein